MGSVAAEEERGGPGDGEAYPGSDETLHFRVLAAPFLGEGAGQVLLCSTRVFGGEAVNGVDQRGEVPSPLEAGGFVLLFLLGGGMSENFGGVHVAIGPGIRVTQTDVEYGPAGTLPKSMGEDVSSRVVARLGGALGGMLAPLASSHTTAIEYGGRDGDARAGEGEGAEVGPFVANIIMMD